MALIIEQKRKSPEAAERPSSLRSLTLVAQFRAAAGRATEFLANLTYRRNLISNNGDAETLVRARKENIPAYHLRAPQEQDTHFFRKVSAKHFSM